MTKTQNNKCMTKKTSMLISCSRFFYLCPPLPGQTHGLHWRRPQAPHWAEQGSWARPGRRSGWWVCTSRGREGCRWWCRSRLRCPGCEPRPQCRCLRWSRWSAQPGRRWYSPQWTPLSPRPWHAPSLGQSSVPERGGQRGQEQMINEQNCVLL